MKRILSLILALIIIATGTVFAETYSDKETVLTAINAVSQSHKPESFVTKQEFAQAAAVLNGAGVIAPVDTAFEDVKKANPYSGYIKYLADNGLIAAEGNFNPEDNCSREFVLTLALKAVGYGEYINMMGGYEVAASKLKLSQNAVFEDGKLTFEGLTDLMFRMLHVPLPDITYTTVGNNYMETVKTFSNKVYLNERLGLKVFNGTITDMDYANYDVEMNIDSVVYAGNSNKYTAGRAYAFDAALTIDINKYEMVPVTFWVDKNDDIVAMYPQEDYKVVYSPISSVNNDDNPNHSYSIGNIKTLTLLDDEEEYDVDPNAVAKHNLELTTGPVRYIGSYAKLVMYDDEVVYIETWDLVEGGIITEITDKNILYRKGTAVQKINPINQFERKIVIINDESRDYDDLKVDTYFDIYKVDEDTLVMVAMERIITSTFNGYGDDFINIGSVSYLKADKLFFSADGTKFTSDEAELLAATGMEVNVYFNSSREACYIKLAPDQVFEKNEFLGLVLGYEASAFNSNAKMAIIPLEGDDMTKKVYDISDSYYKKLIKDDQANPGDRLSLTSILSNAGKIDGNGIYLFTLNGNDEIKKISWAPGIRGFESNGYTGIPDGAGATTVGYIVPGSTTAYCEVSSRNYYYDVDTDLRVLQYNPSGEIVVSTIKPSDTRSNSITNNGGTSGAFLRMFGYDDNMDLRLGVLVGAKAIYKWDPILGFVEKVGIAMDEDGNELVNVILTDGEGSKNYTLTKESADKLPEHGYISWYPDAKLSEDPVHFIASSCEIADLTSDFDQWPANNTAVHTAVVKEVYSNGFVIDEGKGAGEVGYSFRSANVVVMRVGNRGKNGHYKLEKASIDNIAVGDVITYALGTGENQGVIGAIFVR